MKDKIKVYYNEIFVSVTSKDESYEVYANCPYKMIDRENAESLAEFNLQMGIWDSYLIPELLPKGRKVLYNK